MTPAQKEELELVITRGVQRGMTRCVASIVAGMVLATIIGKYL